MSCCTTTRFRFYFLFYFVAFRRIWMDARGEDCACVHYGKKEGSATGTFSCIHFLLFFLFLFHPLHPSTAQYMSSVIRTETLSLILFCFVFFSCVVLFHPPTESQSWSTHISWFLPVALLFSLFSLPHSGSQMTQGKGRDHGVR